MNQSTREFNAAFERQRPHVKARSGGRCETALVVARFLGMPTSPIVVDSTRIVIGSGCTGRAVQIHHRKNRSQGGSNEMDNLAHVCLECHGWIGAHPARSYALGLSLHANDSETL